MRWDLLKVLSFTTATNIMASACDLRWAINFFKKMQEKSWVCTLVTQISLCLAVYLAFKAGHPQEAFLEDGDGRDLYFITVAAGCRSQKEQALLLRQMAKAAELYKAQFVVSISELGDGDPLCQNATRYFRSLKMPWYTTESYCGQGTGHYIKCVKIPFGKTLDIVFVNTESFQGPSNSARENQLSWLTKTLKESTADWRIVAGFHPLLSCNVTTEAKEMNAGSHLHHMLIKYGVDAYLSICKDDVFGETEQEARNRAGKGACLTPLNRIVANKGRADGFILHRVSALDFVSYLVNLNGEVVYRIDLKQFGKEVM